MLEFAAFLLTFAVLLSAGLGVLGHWRRPVRPARLLAHATALTIFLVPSVFIGCWKIINSRTFQFFGGIVPRVETRDKVVALTFDDGPTLSFTPVVLKTLAKEKVHATFFVIGQELKKNPALGKRIVAQGHELGNHTFTHPKMIGKSAAFVRREVEETDALIRQTGFQGEITFRPPFAKKFLVLPLYLASKNRKTITWDIEPDSDAQTAASASGIMRDVMKKVRPGSIILLHAMYSSRRTSREAVPGIIHSLKNQGYRFVTVSELLKHSENKPT